MRQYKSRQAWKDETGIGMFERVYLTKGQADRQGLIAVLGGILVLSLAFAPVWVCPVFILLIAVPLVHSIFVK